MISQKQYEEIEKGDKIVLEVKGVEVGYPEIRGIFSHLSISRENILKVIKSKKRGGKKNG